MKNLSILQLFGLIVLFNMFSCKCNAHQNDDLAGAAEAGMPVLAIESITHAAGNEPGSFVITNNGEDPIDPQTIQVKLTCKSKKACFKINSNAHQNIQTLADVLNAHEPLPAGHTSKPIPFQLAKPGSKPKAALQLELFQQEEQSLAKTKLRWTQKQADVRLSELTYDPQTKRITYQIIKKPGAKINPIKVKYQNADSNNPAFLQLNGQKVTADILLQESDFTHNQTAGSLTVKLDKAAKASFTFTLAQQNDVPIDAKTIRCSRAQLRLMKIVRLKDDQGNYQTAAWIKNKGSKTAKNVTFAYATDSPVSIAGKHKAERTGITIPSTGNGFFTLDLGTLDFAGASAGEFTFTLKHDGDVVDEGKQTLMIKNIQPAFQSATYDPATAVINYAIINEGDEPLTALDQLTLAYAYPDAIKVGDKQNTPIDIPNLPAKKKAAKTGSLKVKLKAQPSAEVTLILKLAGNEVARQTVPCKEVANLVFADNQPAITLEKNKAGKIQYRLQVKNEGKNQAEPKYLKLQITKKAGAAARINQHDLGIAAVKDIPIKQTIAPGKTATIFEGNIDPQTETKVQYELQLVYKEQVVASQTISWKEKQVAIDFIDDNPEVKTSQQAFQFGLTNYGSDTAERNRVALRVTKKSAGKAVVGGQTISQEGAYVDIPAEKLALSANIMAGGQQGGLVLSLDPKANAGVDLTLQLVYDGKPQGIIKRLTWQKVSFS